MYVGTFVVTPSGKAIRLKFRSLSGKHGKRWGGNNQTTGFDFLAASDEKGSDFLAAGGEEEPQRSNWRHR